MPLNNIDLTPYELTSVLKSDNYIIHYDAIDDDDERYIISEFYPAYMVTRKEWGEIEATPRFADEYAQALSKFLDMAYAMKQMNDAPIMRIINVVERNKTAYIVRGVNTYPTVDAYMGGKRMPYGEAYAFIRPLLLSLVQAEERGLVFVFEEGDLRVNRYGQLQIDAVFEWDAAFSSTVTMLAKLFYRLVYGEAFNPLKQRNAPRIDNDDPDEPGEAEPVVEAAAEALMPPRLETMINEILTSGVLYGSIDDFNKKVKFVMDLDNKKNSRSEAKNSAGSSMRVMRWLITGLSVLLVASMGVLVYFVILPVYRSAHPNLADPALIQPAPTVQAVAPDLRNYTTFAVTNPANDNDILNGMYVEQDGYAYYRANKNGYCLVRRGADGVEKILLLDVKPAFIHVYGGKVYFSDGLTGYQLMRVDTDGSNPYILSDDSVLYPYVEGGMLYYTNHTDRDRLYRMDLETGETAPYIKNAVYETISDGKKLYFLNGTNHFNLYAAELGDTPRLTSLSAVNGDNLRLCGGRLYFIDLEDSEIHCVEADGRSVEVESPVKAHGFDITETRLAVIEEGTFQLRLYDRETGEELALPTIRAAYVKIADDALMYTDYDDCTAVRRIDLP